MSENSSDKPKISRKTNRQRNSRKPSIEKSTVILPLPSKEEIFDEIFNYCLDIQRTLMEDNFKIYSATNGNISIPRYFTYRYYKNNRSPHEFNSCLDKTKIQLEYLGFKSVPNNQYLLRHTKYQNLYVNLKRYTQANVIGISLMKYYGTHSPTSLDLL